MFKNLNNNFTFQINNISTEECLLSIVYKSDLCSINLESYELMTLEDLKRFTYHLDALLDDSLPESGSLKFFGKQIEVKFNKRYDVRNEAAVLFVDPSFGVIEQSIDFKINLKNKNEFTNDFIVIHLSKEDVESLNKYIKDKITI